MTSVLLGLRRRGGQSLGKTYELIVYAGDNHAVANNRADRDRRIVEWFKKYIK